MGLGVLAANALLQLSPMRMSQYVLWAIRFVVILSVATTWAQFEPIYDILTNVPGSIGGAMLSDLEAPSLNVAMDDMVTEIFKYGDRADAEASWYQISLVAVLLKLLGALIAAASIVVLAAAKVGLAFAVATAPVFIATLLFGFTSDLFKSWARFTIGFALIPLALAGVMGAILFVGSDVLDAARDGEVLEDALQLIVISIVAVFMMMQVPTMVNSLAGSIVATATGFVEARQAATAAATMASGGAAAAMRAAGAMNHAQRVARSAHATMSQASESTPPQTRMRGLVQEHVAAKAAAKANVERLQRREALFGRETSWAQRREAAWAGAAQYRRENIAAARARRAEGEAETKTPRPEA